MREAYHDHLDDNELSSPGGLGSFALPDWRGGRVQTVSDTCNNPADDHVRDTKCRALQNGPNAHDSSAEKDSVLPAKRFADDEGANGTEETSDIIDSRDCTEKTGVVAQFEGVEKVLRHNNTAEHALVVTEQCLG